MGCRFTLSGTEDHATKVGDRALLIAQTVNNQQMVIVTSEIQNDDLLLKPEMTGVAKIYCGDRRIVDLITRRLIRWLRTEFWDLLP